MVFWIVSAVIFAIIAVRLSHAREASKQAAEIDGLEIEPADDPHIKPPTEPTGQFNPRETPSLTHLKIETELGPRVIQDEGRPFRVVETQTAYIVLFNNRPSAQPPRPILYIYDRKLGLPTTVLQPRYKSAELIKRWRNSLPNRAKRAPGRGLIDGIGLGDDGLVYAHISDAEFYESQVLDVNAAQFYNYGSYNGRY